MEAPAGWIPPEFRKFIYGSDPIPQAALDCLQVYDENGNLDVEETERHRRELREMIGVMDTRTGEVFPVGRGHKGP